MIAKLGSKVRDWLLQDYTVKPDIIYPAAKSDCPPRCKKLTLGLCIQSIFGH